MGQINHVRRKSLQPAEFPACMRASEPLSLLPRNLVQISSAKEDGSNSKASELLQSGEALRKEIVCRQRLLGS